ncbi:MAG: LytR C-terminal domain-containing protein [Candidatus Levybacteria bacterium]|nr:LytR C-terminal domain-containing protein [Candidatus Levybacteria bacterium]
MRRKKTDSGFGRAKVAIFFAVFVILVVLFSLIFKVLKIVEQSKFDNYHRFTISVANNRKTEVISFLPSDKKIWVIKIDGDLQSNSQNDLNRFLEITTDARVENSSLNLDNEVPVLMSSVLTGFGNFKTDLTIIDAFRLFLFSKTIPKDFIGTKNISTSLQSLEVDKTISSLFADAELVKDIKTIEITNAADVPNLGGRLARLITNMGGNVVLITTDNAVGKESSIFYTGKKTYTVDRLSRILGFKSVESQNLGIADIKIVIGTDSLPKLVF